MAFLRWLIRLISGLTQFALYSLLFFALMVGAGYWVALQFFGGEEIKAPDLSGLSVIEALDKLRPIQVSLEFERAPEPHVQVQRDHIISQYPAPGSVIKSGTPIRIVVSSGSPLVTVPDLRGRNKIEVGIRLRKIGLDVGNVAMIPREGIPGGALLSTDPPIGAGALSGSKVNLLLAAGDGAHSQQMPNLIGLTRDEAAEVLASYSLSIGDAHEAPSGDPDIPAGHIHSQTPGPGETIPPNGKVTIVTQPPVSDQPTAATTQTEEGFPSSFYRSPGGDENTFKGNDESQTFRGEQPPADAPPPAAAIPAPESDTQEEGVPAVQPSAEATPAPDQGEAPAVNIDFGQREPGTPPGN